MDQLLQQLAQTLKIPTDALQTVLSNYPKLRQEYVIYHSLYIAAERRRPPISIGG